MTKFNLTRVTLPLLFILFFGMMILAILNPRKGINSNCSLEETSQKMYSKPVKELMLSQLLAVIITRKCN